jgi:hypothetical protein
VNVHPDDETEKAEEQEIRNRLINGDFVVRESARDALIERWGEQEWFGWLRGVAKRLGHGGVASYDEASSKWVVSDRRDRVVITGDGRVLAAVFPGAQNPQEVLDGLRAGEVSISPAVLEVLNDRLGSEAESLAAARIAAMAEHGTLTWRDDSALGGWRLAADGDVALLDSRARTVLKLFWSRLDSRPGASIEDVRTALGAGTLRPARRLVWRLERAWGPAWEKELTARCADLASSGQVAEHGDNAFEVVGGGVSMLVTKDAQVIVSARIELSGDAETIRGAVLAGEVPAHPDTDPNSPRYRAPSSEVFSTYARALAAVAPAQPTSTHWTIRFGGAEVALGTDGANITGIMTRPTDNPAEAAALLGAGVVFVRPAVRKQFGDVVVSGWLGSVDQERLHRTPQGWRLEVEGGRVILDGSATLVVGFEDGEQR